MRPIYHEYVASVTPTGGGHQTVTIMACSMDDARERLRMQGYRDIDVWGYHMHPCHA